ncbi:MAG: glycosyltransferase family 9 protein [Bacteriovorax sp.]|nr:glycosyltransferase family 9 protein [Bacteriovorax sp.]
MSKAPTIMLVKNRALGDSIMGLSAVQYLKLLYPQSNIIYAVPQWIAPLYSESVTSADEIYPLRILTFKDILKLFKDIKALKVDHIHEMHQSGRGAKIFKMISFFLRIPYTAHNHHLKTGTEVLDQGVIKPLIQRDLDGVYSFLGIGERPNYLEYSPQINPIEKISKLPMIIMGVVATRKTKMWPLENYLKLASLIQVKFPNYAIVIPLSKGPDDKKIKEELFRIGLPDNVSILESELKDLPANIKQAAFYIGNDTGLKHLAVAVGIKTYTFFGPEPANEWHPYDSNNHPYFYLEGLACRTRTHHYCGLSVCDLSEGYMQCLSYFKPEIVFSEIENYMYGFSPLM